MSFIKIFKEAETVILSQFLLAMAYGISGAVLRMFEPLPSLAATYI